MPELRHDPIQKRWVIIASERAARPDEFSFLSMESQAEFCPFCEGNEDKTPPEVFAFRNPPAAANSPGWQVRVTPNKYPALRLEGELERKGVGLHDRMNGIGAHEVVIETPLHRQTICEMPIDQVVLVLKAYRERLNELMKDERLKYILIFKNHGALAGASLSHPHTQIIATPITPRAVANELKSAKNHFQRKERCLFCDLIAEELDRQVRLVHQDRHYVSFAPYASRFPFELFLAPHGHQANFGTINDEEIHGLAQHLKEVLGRIKKGLHDPPYNFVLHTSPNVKAPVRKKLSWDTLESDYHWHFEIMPRLTRVAGFEWGTGFYINPVSPEEGAQFLRELR